VAVSNSNLQRTITNENCLQKEIKNKLNVGSASHQSL
jgi:hypothetical protein